MRKIFLFAAFWVGCNLTNAQNHAINVAHMDTNVRPQDDFYNFVNGNWMKTTTIPSDRARWGSFDELRENTDVATLKILKESLDKKHPEGSDAKKIADLYQSYIDFDTRNRVGVQPIQARLKDWKKYRISAHYIATSKNTVWKAVIRSLAPMCMPI